MRLDHLSYAAEKDGLAATAERLSAALGVNAVEGGFHPRFGTHNLIIPLRNRHYLEVVGVLDHPAALKEPFGQVVRARSAAGGGWMCWAVAVGDLPPFEQRLGRHAAPGERTLPDGRQLHWQQLGVTGMMADPQLPYLIKWEGEPALHPSQAGPTDATLATLTVAGSPDRVKEWLGEPVEGALPEVAVEWAAPHGTPGILSATFHTPRGPVTI